MNKTDLIRAVHERMDKKMTLKDIDLVVGAMFDVMSERLKAGEEIQLSDFGTFSLTRFAVKPAETFTRNKRV